MAQPNLDDLVARLRRLSPEELGRVVRVVEAIETADVAPRSFEQLCGVVPKVDIDAMMDAIAECERIDSSEW